MNLVNLSILNDNPTLTPNKIQEGLGIFVPGPDRRKVFVTETVTISFRLKDKSVAKRGVFPTTGVTYTETFGIVESLGVDFILGAEWINDEDILRGWRSLFSLPAASRVSRIAVAPSGTQPSLQANFPIAQWLVLTSVLTRRTGPPYASDHKSSHTQGYSG
jgi:hypothetical protein